MMNRKNRNVLALFCIMLVALVLPLASYAKAKKVLVLGVDGLDPRLLQRFVDKGMMPNFAKLMTEGDFKPLQTSAPPLSPVAWATFITGRDPGGHGIFGFVHRNPQTRVPFEAMAQAYPPKWQVNLGSWVIPLSEGGVELQRKGVAFWQMLDEHGVPGILYRIPDNFPPVDTKCKTVSGMGTTDITGSPGSFSYFTTHPPEDADDVSGGKVFPVAVKNNRVDAQLRGPKNTFRRVPKMTATGVPKKDDEGNIEYTNPVLTADFSVFLDPEKPVAHFEVQGDEFVLKQGEWSDWVRVHFEAVPWMVNISATARFYLKEVRPEFKLYVSPLQIDPANPAIQISTPSGWSRELCDAVGPFYTQTLPIDNKAFSEGILTASEFWQQAMIVQRERRQMLEHLLGQWDEGLLFFYFCSVDQNSHMLWHFMDKKHPGYTKEEFFDGSIGRIYQMTDDSLGYVLDAIDDDTVLVVMSDHGFGLFYWGFNVNSWLVEKGYLVLKNPAKQGAYGDFELFVNVDWSRSTAYGTGMNGICVNQKGREKGGIVETGEEKQALLDRLERDLLELRDPRNGNRVVTLVTRPERDFNGPHIEIGPDIIIGYNQGYRIAWESTIGGIPKELFTDNKAAWSADHAVDYRLVPGVLLTNQRITMEKPALYDLTVAILDEYGIEKLPEMIGQDCLAPRNGGAKDKRVALNQAGR